MGLNMGPATDPVVCRDVAQMAEGLGYESLWVGDHPVLPHPPVAGSPFPPGYPFGAPLIALAYLAGHTRRALLATGVLLVPQRSLVHLVKEVATLDQLCSGRLLLGVGVGYLEAEFRALGVSRRDRGRRTEEYLAAMKALWHDPRTTVGSTYVSIEGVEAFPAPLQPGGPPLIVGGHSEAAFDRAARLGDGWLGWFLRPDQTARRVERLHGRPRPNGRQRLEISVMPSMRLTPEVVEEYGRAGVDRIVVSPSPHLDADGLIRFVERNAPNVLGLAHAAGR